MKGYDGHFAFETDEDNSNFKFICFTKDIEEV